LPVNDRLITAETPLPIPVGFEFHFKFFFFARA
jgi:hypothetical protein